MAQEKILSLLLKLTFRTFAMPESPSALSFVDSENYKIQVYLIVLQLRPWTRWIGYKIWGINRAKHPSSCLNKFWVLENFNRKVNRVFAKRITLQKFYGIKKSAAKYHYSAKSGFLKNFRLGVCTIRTRTIRTRSALIG